MAQAPETSRTGSREIFSVCPEGSRKTHTSPKNLNMVLPQGKSSLPSGASSLQSSHQGCLLGMEYLQDEHVAEPIPPQDALREDSLATTKEEVLAF